MFLIILAILPAAVLGVYIYKKDRVEKEPLPMLAWLFVLGGLTTISTDFREMGRLAARMILDRKPSKIHCPFRMTRRSTF